MTSDADYRRGTVLGFTVAEIFILLLFLLLLLFLIRKHHMDVLAADRQNEVVQVQKQLAVLQEKTEPWSAVFEEFKEPDSIETLKRQVVQERQRADNLADNAETLQKLEESGIENVDEYLDELKRARTETQDYKDQLEDYQKQLNVFKTKGINPPCWYQVVPDPEKHTREKPYYTLEVGVFDEYMVLRKLDPPPGAAFDDNSVPYSQEATELNLHGLPYNQRLSDADFNRILKPLHDDGKNARVRSYSCIFWVKVWDNTSPTSKRRWKRAHDSIIEGLFGAYTIKDQPW